MNVFYLIVGLFLLAVIILGSHINEAIAKIYWRKKLGNKSCYEQASFLYKLIRFYRMFPAKYTNVRSDRVKTYLCLYVNSTYPCNMQERAMQEKMLNIWYCLKEQETA
ncbi:MAG: hypothetical protein E7010_00290 [Alphaproteobacteria bacterium]|nr:hypothetical protein [Alphaproteobacteria bacterium]